MLLTVRGLVVTPALKVSVPVERCNRLARAVSLAVAYDMVTVRLLTAESVTVKVSALLPEFASVTETSLITAVGVGSLSTMVPRPCRRRSSRRPPCEPKLKGLVSLVEQIACDRHVDLLRHRPRRKHQSTGCRRVVSGGSRGGVCGRG